MAKIRAGFNEKTGKWRWVPKVWHLRWDYSPSGPTYYITKPLTHGSTSLYDISAATDRVALAFANEKMAWGYASALTSLFGKQVLPVLRWNGHPPVPKEKVLR